MSKKFFTLIHGDSVHIAPKTKVIPAQEFSTLQSAEEVLETVKKDAEKYKKEVVVEIEKLKEQAQKEGFEAADVENGIRVYRAVGCGQCTDGYKGRMGIYQVMPVTETIGRIIMEGGGAMDINDQATKDGVWNLRRAGLEKVRAGVTSLEEINSVTID